MFTQPTNSCRIFSPSISFFPSFHFEKPIFSCAFPHTSFVLVPFFCQFALTTIFRAHTQTYTPTRSHSTAFVLVVDVQYYSNFYTSFLLESPRLESWNTTFGGVGEGVFTEIFLTLIKYAKVLNDINMLKAKKKVCMYIFVYGIFYLVLGRNVQQKLNRYVYRSISNG